MNSVSCMAIFWCVECVSSFVQFEKRLTLFRRFYALGFLFQSHGSETDAIQV